MSQQRVRPATVKTSTRRIGRCGPEAAVPAGTSGGVPLVIEAERGEGVLSLRNGFTLSDHAERGFQVVGQG